MKECIEKKIGCSIDEWIKRWKEKMLNDKKNGWETEERSDTLILTEEERNFMMDYCKRIA